MVAHEIHTLIPVEPMRVQALDPGIKDQHIAFVLPSMLREPIEEKTPVSFGAGLLVGDQVVNVKVSAIKEIFRDPEPGDAANLLLVGEEYRA